MPEFPSNEIMAPVVNVGIQEDETLEHGVESRSNPWHLACLYAWPEISVAVRSVKSCLRLSA